MVVIEFLGQVAAEHEQSGTDVALQLAATQDFSHGAGRLSSPDLQLEQPIARGIEALSEEEIVFGLGVDMRDPPPVDDDLDGTFEARDGQGLLSLQRHRTQGVGEREEYAAGCEVLATHGLHLVVGTGCKRASRAREAQVMQGSA